MHKEGVDYWLLTDVQALRWDCCALKTFHFVSLAFHWISFVPCDLKWIVEMIWLIWMHRHWFELNVIWESKCTEWFALRTLLLCLLSISLLLALPLSFHHSTHDWIIYRRILIHFNEIILKSRCNQKYTAKH